MLLVIEIASMIASLVTKRIGLLLSEHGLMNLNFAYLFSKIATAVPKALFLEFYLQFVGVVFCFSFSIAS